MIIKVLLPVAGVSELDYLCHKKFSVQKHQVVLVPFRKTQKIGIVVGINIPESSFALRDVINVFPIQFPDDLMQFLSKASEYYLQSQGEIIKLLLPLNLNTNDLEIWSQKQEKTSIQSVGINLKPLSENQIHVLQQINFLHSPVLLHGVTGSGKTEIYFHLVKQVLLEQGQALILLPEISLTRQIVDRFQEQFGETAVIWNSKIGIKHKKEIFYSILQGSAKVIIGARSALFLPYTNLKLIVVDEEHDASYKQEHGVLYNARDMAVLRSYCANGYNKPIRTLLCSATPSLESIYNAYRSKYHLVTLASRYGESIMPEISKVKMINHPKYHFLSCELLQAIEYNIKNKQQTLLFLNRKGYAPIVFCKKCLIKTECKNCSTALGFYKRKNLMICNQCGYSKNSEFYCDQCKEPLFFLGFGIEQVEEAMKSLFPDQKVITLSRDHNSSNRENKLALQSIAEGQIDIIIGTQLITKGYHFPEITLVGVLDLDFSLFGSDIRALEKTYQMLHQVAGRAGRGDKPGKALIQSYFADQELFDIIAGPYDVFVKYELNRRMQNNLPPFTKSCVILFSSKLDNDSKRAAKIFSSSIQSFNKNKLRILGPTNATIAKVDNCFRYKVLLFFSHNLGIREYIRARVCYALNQVKKVKAKIDFDPQNFY